MSITRKMLKGMGLTEDQQDTILEAHTETLNEIKAERDRLREEAAETAQLKQQLEQARADMEAATKTDWQQKYAALKKDFDQYKTAQTAKETKAAKQAAARAYLQSKNIQGDNLNIALRGMGAEIDALTLDEGGGIKDTAALDALIAGDYKGLVTTTTEKGAPPPANPPKNVSGKMSREQIYARDEKGRYVLSTEERQAAIAANLDQF